MQYPSIAPTTTQSGSPTPKIKPQGIFEEDLVDLEVEEEAAIWVEFAVWRCREMVRARRRNRTRSLGDIVKNSISLPFEDLRGEIIEQVSVVINFKWK